MTMNSSIHDVHSLIAGVLEQLGKYEELPSSIRNTDFNVFEATGVGKREVTMCAFLAALIDPDSRFGSEIQLLQSFCEMVLGIEEDTGWSNAKVRTEVAIDGERRIDLVIQSAVRFIPIEVKLYAADQDGQCYDYYRYALNYDENAVLYYLTLDGHDPSPDSKRDLADGTHYKRIAFGVEVLDWIYSLLDREDVRALPNLYSILRQYKETLEDMTGRQRKDVTELLGNLICTRETFHAANEINKSLPVIKAGKMCEFFSCIKGKLHEYESEYQLVHEGFNKQASDYYMRRTNTWPSLNYLLPQHPGAPDQRFVLRIEVESNLYFGVCNWDDETKTNPHGTKEQEKRNYVLNHSGVFGNGEQTDAFYWWKYLKWDGETIDFRNCNSNYEKLFDQEELKTIIGHICEEVSSFLRTWDMGR